MKHRDRYLTGSRFRFSTEQACQDKGIMETIKQNHYYHIYNRGIDGTNLFNDDENKYYFLKLAKKHLMPKMDVLSYCLMDNHFHLLVQISSDSKSASQAFSNLFNSYTKAFNNRFQRTGGLFERPFKRKEIKSEDYLRKLILYIHKNPENHNITDDYRNYNFSSYKQIINKENSIVEKRSNEVIALFEDLENFKFVHRDFELLEEDLQARLPNEQGWQNLAGRVGTDFQDEKSGNAHNLDNHPSTTDKPNLQGLQDLAGLQSQNDNIIKSKFLNYIHTLQNTITSKLEEIDGKAQFKEDIWERPEGGGGKSRIIENGNIFEKGGVNISAVHGELPTAMQQYFKVGEVDFFACGLSLVLHPKNPMAPTVHANWRYFEMYDKDGNIVDQWFGGGQDLTPYYLFDEDAAHFHSVCKEVCDRHNHDFYPKFKKQCDTYFWNAHRDEARGVGGLFFDYCRATDEISMDAWYNFVTDVGDSFLDAYVPIIVKRKDLNFTEQQRDWQEIRRGRYVEFNLVHDKGTLFGLKTNGRIESILMSLPPKVQWVYDHKPEVNSEEERLIEVLKKPKEWIPPSPQRGNSDRNEN